jgi:drug/metabolite transporter (DMT)-like permease
VLKTFLYLLLITLAEATIGIFVKLTGDAVPLLALNFYRVGFAFAFLLLTVPFIKRDFWEMDRYDVIPVIVIGFFIALQISLFNLAMSLAPIANVVIFWSIAPFFVFIFSWIFLKEKAGKGHILTFLIALAGIIIAKPLEGGVMAGNLTALASGISYAGLVTYLRYEGRDESPSMVVWYMGSATLLLSPALFFYGAGDLMAVQKNSVLPFEWPALVWVLCLGVFSTGLAYLCMSLVLKRVSANVYSLVDIIVSPIVAAIFAYFIFEEMPSSNMLYGGAMLLFSGAWLSHRMRKEQKG